MSGLFNQASLVLVPSGYKAGKVYSQVPISGDGDLTFTRASDATRVNSDGLIEKVRTNLLLYSEQFDNAAWTKIRASVTANAATSPDGYTNADAIIASSVFDDHFITQNIAVINATSYAFSVFLKKGNKNWARLWNTAVGYVDFDLTNGVVGTESSATGIIQSFGDGWYRCTIQYTANSTSSQPHRIYTLEADNNRTFTGDGSTVNLYIYGAQLEVGDIATDYIPTTTAAVSVGMTANVPRLDYSQGSCPALLLEPQRTNLLTYSEQFDNAVHFPFNLNAFGSGSVANTTAVLAPNGTNSADYIQEDSAASVQHSIIDLFSGNVSGTTYTFSVFAKAAERTIIQLVNNGGGGGQANFNLSTGVATLNSGVSASMQSFINGWYRCILTYTSSTTGNHNVQIRLCDSSGNATYNGTGNQGVFVWGAQLEAGLYATSYIPTTSATVTRLADRVNRSALGLTNSTFVVNFRPLNHTVEVFDFQKSGGARMFYIAINSVRQVAFNSVSGGTIGAIGSPITINQTCKLAFTLNASTSNVVVFINGLKIGTYATDITTFDRFSQLETFGFAQGTQIEQITIFPSVLTDSDCITLTTL